MLLACNLLQGIVRKVLRNHEPTLSKTSVSNIAKTTTIWMLAENKTRVF